MTDGSGNLVGELRYHPYGGTRYSWGSTPTGYRFTGQREDATIGLYFYNARYYDPALGRFISADTVVPNPHNSQSLNRYSYVLGNPLRYIDPSGHCIPGLDCLDEYQQGSEAYGIDFKGNWPKLNKNAVFSGAAIVGQAMRRSLIKRNRELVREGNFASVKYVPDSATLFRLVMGDVTFKRIDGNPITGWAETHLDWVGNGCNQGEICYDDSMFNSTNGVAWGAQNVGHELVHGIDQRGGRHGRADLNAARIGYTDAEGQTVQVAGGGWEDGYERRPIGFEEWPWQQNKAPSPGEEFADMFLGWAHNHFTNDAAGVARYQWMSDNMFRWINLAIPGRW